MYLYFVFILGLKYQTFRGLVLKLLFENRRRRIPQFFLKNMPSIWANFNHVFEVFKDVFFTFLLQRKDPLGRG